MGFPDLDEALGGGKSKKKQQPTKAQIQKDQEEVLQALPTKGKSSQFFAHTGTPNQEQMVFIFHYYPQYSMNPIDIQNWLYGEAIRLETDEKAKQMLEQQAYGQPPRSKNRNNNYPH